MLDKDFTRRVTQKKQGGDQNNYYALMSSSLVQPSNFKEDTINKYWKKATEDEIK